MNWAFKALGLGADVEINQRAIKRAYAAKLKATRPDEDPEGFQQLHEAYQQALSCIRRREIAPDSHADDSNSASPATEHVITDVADLLPELHSQLESLETKISNAEALLSRRGADGAKDEFESTDATPPADAGTEFDFEAFLKQCTELAEYSRDGELLNWLNAQPILWSLQYKAQIGHWLLQHLHAQRPPVPGVRFDVLANFFGLNDLHSGYDPYHIHMLRHRLQLAWEVKTHQVRLLAERTGREGNSLASAIRQTDRILKQLIRPFRWPQALFAGLMPQFPSAVRRFLFRLDHGRLDDLPASIDEEQARFWVAATDSLSLSKPRLMLGATRCVVYAWLCIAIVSTYDFLNTEVLSLPKLLSTASTLVACMVTGWLAMMGGQALQHWQCMPEDNVVRYRWLHHVFIPVIFAVSIGLSLIAHMDAAATLLGMAGAASAWHRYRARGGTWANPFARLGTWALGPIFLLICVVSFLIEYEPRIVTFSPAAVALLFWIADLLRHLRKN